MLDLPSHWLCENSQHISTEVTDPGLPYRLLGLPEQAISKGTYRKLKTGSCVAQPSHSTVNNSVFEVNDSF